MSHTGITTREGTGLGVMQAKPEPTTPSHLVELPGGEWSMWRCVAVRSAGFPSERVLDLNAPAAASAAEAVLAVEARLQHERAATTSVFDSELKRLKQEGRWEAAKKYRLWLIYAMRSMRYGKPPDSDEPEGIRDQEPSAAEMANALARVVAAEAELATALAEYEREFASGTSIVSEALRTIATNDRFREAVAWQNRHALHGSIASMLRLSAEEGKQGGRRKYEEVVASYWQRYCVKNDTIGFFGPVGWARIVDQPETFAMRPGPSLLASRTVFLEHWGIDELARTLAKNKAYRIWMSPRRPPHIRIENGTVLHPLTGVVKMPREMVTVLAACDGVQTAKEVAAKLIADPSNRLKTEEQVKGILDVLLSRGMIIWEFQIPFGFHPEETLRRHLNRIEDDELRKPALECLDQIERARDGLVDAAGDADRVDQAMGALESLFTTLTGASATRSEGKIYAGRTLAYEDCRRDLDAEIGTDFLDVLAPPVSLLVASGRWFTHEFAKLCRQIFKDIYDGLVRQTGSTDIDGSVFWLRAQPIVDDEQSTADQILPEFQKRWRDILALPPNTRRVNLSSEALRPLVNDAFDAPAPGWIGARYHCPDVMIDAASVEAIRRGDYQLVMGELHIATNTLAGPVFLSQHPAPEELFAAVESDIPVRRAVPVTPKAWLTSRTNYMLISPRDYRIEFDRDSFVLPRQQTVAVADLIVKEIDGEVRVCTRDGQIQFDIVEIFGHALSGVVVNHLKIFGAEAHTPRITIDRLVIARETWRLPAAEATFAFEKEGSARFLGARRWATARELPRRIFIKVPVESKPLYVDFDSPVLVGLLAKLARRCVEADAESLITVTEMLPSIEHTWLTDREGNRYTCELRSVVVDRRAPA
ncbi:MAG TPA: lantibiotic dehydratase [Pyrinomonadaceae bacterium]|nr:lantibiotic dehydratase [Pyrinomonadaceae bacterium]